MAEKDCVRGLKLKNKNYSLCETCQFGKSHKLSYAKRDSLEQSFKKEDFSIVMCVVLRSVIRRREIFFHV